jgi:hypothetical protein
MSRPQFRLRSLFILTTVVAVGCVVGPPIVRPVIARVREWITPPIPKPSKKQCLGARSGPGIPMSKPAATAQEAPDASDKAGLPIFEQWRAAELMTPVADAPGRAPPPNR